MPIVRLSEKYSLSCISTSSSNSAERYKIPAGRMDAGVLLGDTVFRGVDAGVLLGDTVFRVNVRSVLSRISKKFQGQP